MKKQAGRNYIKNSSTSYTRSILVIEGHPVPGSLMAISQGDIGRVPALSSCSLARRLALHHDLLLTH